MWMADMITGDSSNHSSSHLQIRHQQICLRSSHLIWSHFPAVICKSTRKVQHLQELLGVLMKAMTIKWHKKAERAGRGRVHSVKTYYVTLWKTSCTDDNFSSCNMIIFCPGIAATWFHIVSVLTKNKYSLQKILLFQLKSFHCILVF